MITTDRYQLTSIPTLETESEENQDKSSPQKKAVCVGVQLLNSLNVGLLKEEILNSIDRENYFALVLETVCAQSEIFITGYLAKLEE